MPNVLIIDQDANIRRLIRQVLEHIGYTVAEASTFMDVSLQLADSLPDVIILDCLLGGYGLGLDLLQEIRANPRTSDIAVVVTTAIPEPAIDTRLRNCGATAYLLKPFGPRDLVQAIAVATGIKGAPAPESAAAS